MSITRTIRKPTFLEGLIPILFTICVLIVGKGIIELPTEICLLLSATFAGVVAVTRLGHNWQTLEGFIIGKLSSVMPAVLIVIFVGFMVATWNFSGTLPMLVYYGVKFINPVFVYLVMFISTAVLAYLSGTSWGSVASIGVALMGVAAGLGVDLSITAAAAVSGAYFGDKLSPLSDTTNLASAVTSVPIYDHIKYMLWTTIPGTICSLVVFTLLGLRMMNEGGIIVPANSDLLLTQITSVYNLNVLLLLPIIVILVCIFLKLPTLPAMIASSFAAVIVGAIVPGFDWQYGVSTTIFGFNIANVGIDPSTLLPNFTSLLNRGGLAKQGGFLSFIICAMIFAGIITGTGMMNSAMSNVVKNIKGVGELVLASGIVCFLVNIFTGSDGLNKVITSEFMLKKFIVQKVHPIVLSRTLEDFGTMTGPLIPWSAAGMFMSTTLGVATLDYLPFCFLSFCSILFALLYAFTGFNIKKITDEEAIQMAKDRNIDL